MSAQLDEVRRLAFHSQEALDAIRDREAEATGITGLKIAFNNVFGYYLEVRNAHKDKVPEGWIRKQTLTQAERYITEELKELESQILNAKEQTESLEHAAFSALVAACVAGGCALDGERPGDGVARHAGESRRIGDRPGVHPADG